MIRDLVKNFIGKLSSDEGNAIRYRTIYAFCFVIHSFYAILFGCVNVKELMIFNIFSSAMYFIGMLVIKNNKLTLLWLILLSCEIMAHGFLCCFFLGFEYLFTLFSLAILPVTFFMTYLDPSVRHPFILSGFLAAVNTAVMMISLEIDGQHDHAYNNFPQPFITLVARLNLIFGILILLSFSVMFIGKIHFDLKVLKNQNDTLDRLANYDQLTGLRNRNHIYEIFEQYIKSTDPYCVILGDIDDFKHVNDTYGHSYGDEVLKTVSRIISETVGDNGVVCRWGGEEILILVKGSYEYGVRTTEDILKKIRSASVDKGNIKIRVTMTFGLCDYSDAMNIEKLISLADKRLYIGKNNGKDQLVAKS